MLGLPYLEERETDGWIRVSAKQERLFQLTYGVMVPRPKASRGLLRRHPWLTAWLASSGSIGLFQGVAGIGWLAGLCVTATPAAFLYDKRRLVTHGHLVIARAAAPCFGENLIKMDATIDTRDLKRELRIRCPDSQRLRDIVDEHGGADVLVLVDPKTLGPAETLDAIAFRVPSPDGHVSSGHAPVATLALSDGDS